MTTLNSKTTLFDTNVLHKIFQTLHITYVNVFTVLLCFLSDENIAKRVFIYMSKCSLRVLLPDIFLLCGREAPKRCMGAQPTPRNYWPIKHSTLFNDWILGYDAEWVVKCRVLQGHNWQH